MVHADVHLANIMVITQKILSHKCWRNTASGLPCPPTIPRHCRDELTRWPMWHRLHGLQPSFQAAAGRSLRSTQLLWSRQGSGTQVCLTLSASKTDTAVGSMVQRRHACYCGAAPEAICPYHAALRIADQCSSECSGSPTWTVVSNIPWVMAT